MHVHVHMTSLHVHVQAPWHAGLYEWDTRTPVASGRGHGSRGRAAPARPVVCLCARRPPRFWFLRLARSYGAPVDVCAGRWDAPYGRGGGGGSEGG